MESQRQLFTYTTKIEEDLLCLTCKCPLVEPVVHSECGLMFCKSCVQMTKQPWCSCCRVQLNVSSIHTAPRFVINKLQGLPVICNGCGAHCNRMEFSDHAQSCVVDCRLGCGTKINLIDRNYHEAQCQSFPCSAQDVLCSWRGPLENLKNHEAICPLVATRPILLAFRKQISDQQSILMHQQRQMVVLELVTGLRTSVTNQDFSKFHVNCQNIQGVKFEGCMFVECILEMLEDCIFIDCDFTGAKSGKFTKCAFVNCIFENSTLTHSRCNYTKCQPPIGTKFIPLEEKKVPLRVYVEDLVSDLPLPQDMELGKRESNGKVKDCTKVANKEPIEVVQPPQAKNFVLKARMIKRCQALIKQKEYWDIGELGMRMSELFPKNKLPCAAKTLLKQIPNVKVQVVGNNGICHVSFVETAST